MGSTFAERHVPAAFDWQPLADLIDPREPRYCCAEAGHLATYAAQLDERLPVLATPATAAQVEQAEDAYRDACFRLQQRWFEIRQSSPGNHRDNPKEGRDEPPCVYGVYLAALARLVDYRNRLPPPLHSFEEARRQYKVMKRDRDRQIETATTHWHPLEIDHADLVTVDEPE